MNKCLVFAKLVNRGTGAGGSNTNKSGLLFEKCTDMSVHLIRDGYHRHTIGKGKNSYYLQRNYANKAVYFTTQGGLKHLLKSRYNITIFRQPDEAYLIEYPHAPPQLKILEKKNQNTEGSVDQKLGLGGYMKREYYKCCEGRFDVHYAFTLSDYFKTKFAQDPKWTVTRQIMDDDDITIFFGHDPMYFNQLNSWIHQQQ